MIYTTNNIWSNLFYPNIIATDSTNIPIYFFNFLIILWYKNNSQKKKIIFRIWLKNAEILYELISFKIKIFELHEFLWKKKKK